MTERKPREITFASWVDQQISEAAERGAFDDLPAGKPISRRGGTDAWLQDYLRREGVSGDELLPTPLRLRKEVERLAASVQDLRSEQEVREVVKGLNRQIAEWRRLPTGPPVYVRLVDEEAMVARWRDARRGPPSPPPPARPRDRAVLVVVGRLARGGGVAVRYEPPFPVIGPAGRLPSAGRGSAGPGYPACCSTSRPWPRCRRPPRGRGRTRPARARRAG